MLSAVANTEGSLSSVNLGFLSQAAQDEALRAELAANPIAALARYGFEIDPQHVPACVTLPTKEALMAQLSSFTDEEDEGPLTEKIWFGFIAS